MRMGDTLGEIGGHGVEFITMSRYHSGLIFKAYHYPGKQFIYQSLWVNDVGD